MPTINKTKLDIKIEGQDGSDGSPPLKVARLGGDQKDSDIVDELPETDKESHLKNNLRESFVI